MNKEALNKKLAEWAGLEWKMTTGGERCLFDGDDICSPTANNNLVPFTESLDACFKWLVPRLWICNITLEEAIFWDVHVSIPDYHGKNKHGNGQALDENPALALCLAIEKLIDGGAK